MDNTVEAEIERRRDRSRQLKAKESAQRRHQCLDAHRQCASAKRKSLAVESEKGSIRGRGNGDLVVADDDGGGGGGHGCNVKKVSSEREARRRNRQAKIERQKAKVLIENENKHVHEMQALKTPGKDEVKHVYQ